MSLCFLFYTKLPETLFWAKVRESKDYVRVLKISVKMVNTKCV